MCRRLCTCIFLSIPSRDHHCYIVLYQLIHHIVQNSTLKSFYRHGQHGRACLVATDIHLIKERERIMNILACILYIERKQRQGYNKKSPTSFMPAKRDVKLPKPSSPNTLTAYKVDRLAKPRENPPILTLQ